MAPRPKHNAQTRRRRRRAADRRVETAGAANLRPDDILEIEQLVAAASGATPADEISALAAEALAEFGGKPSQGTRPDKRLKDNKGAMEETPEQAALAALDAYQAETDPDARELAAAYVKARPDLEGFEAEIEELVQRALSAAAGDVAWGPEEGFVDLLCDVNEILGAGNHDDDTGGGNDYDYEPSGPRAIDVSVKLDKVRICDSGDEYVAPITIDASGDPIISDRSEWIPAERGLIEVPAGDDESMTAATQIRFALRDIELVADGATAPPIPPEHQPKEVVPKKTSRIVDPTPPAGAATDGSIRWTATFVLEGVLTEDGRAFAPGALILPPDEGARQLPLSLMAMIETSDVGHNGAQVAGRVDQLWREGNLVKAAGVFSEEEFGAMIARMVGNGELRGLSVDIAALEVERGPASDWFDADGNWIAQRGADGDWIPVGDTPTLDEAVERLFGGGIVLFTKAVIGAATVCPFPAFGQANISLAASGAVTYSGQAGFVTLIEPESLVAAAACDCDIDVEVVAEEPSGLTAAAAGLAPEQPPVEWFDNPELEELTPLTIDDDGRIYGHAWQWDTCHLSFDSCVVAPHSQTDYAYYRLGEVECDGGERVAVGKVTLDTGHAGQRLSRVEATRHYDDTGTVAAHVAFGEDEFGGWFAGAISPDLDEAKLRLLRGATVSGDWRGVDGNLELVALLAVNVPGFPVPRPRAIIASGEYEDGEPDVLSLTAAGIVGLTSAEEAEIRELAAAAQEDEPAETEA
jgi:hypothetical protein